MENDPWENLKAQLTAANTQDNMLGRPDYYQDVFAIQNSLDAALAQKQIEQEAQRILEDPVLLEQFIKQTGGDSAGLPTGDSKGSRSPISIGTGAQTDQIKQDALKAGIRGLLTGGVPGALMGGAKSYLFDTAKTLFDVNMNQDPLGRLNDLQRWTKAPVESRTGKTPAEIAIENQEFDKIAAAKQAAAEQAARNVEPVSTYTPTGSASDWSPVDSNGNISWSGQTYSPSAYEGLMP